MATIKIHIPDYELNIIKDFARANNSNLSEIIRRTMIERIEDE
ncbi:hypothetical protein SAMN02745671_00362 [Anaerovibrio lipolyticus DSM 3074]|uniref:Ribbon-helix-helix protein, copG family n=1 Tax=Anaerovibrio lipolyticus DSM 3074 TaxID=1120997 RepID=A0A1M6AHS7_9FIRM